MPTSKEYMNDSADQGVCAEQPALFAEFNACKDALVVTWNEMVTVFQAEEPIENEA